MAFYMSTARGTPTTQRAARRPWLFGYLVAVLLLLLYVGGYFTLMDTHRPTSLYLRASDYFESSFRWAKRTRASKDDSGPETAFPEVTIWNVIYRPMDKLYFHFFPRSSNEVERLRAIGYYR